MAYRILSLDGGGTWALIQVKALMAIYGNDASGYDVLKDFDLVVANSGGSVVAAGLACNFKLQKLLSDFLDPEWLNTIFVDLPVYDKLDPLRLVAPMPKYDAAAKLQGLRGALGPGGDIALEQLPAQWGGKPHLLITSFDYDRQRAVFFRTNLQSPARSAASPIPATLAEAVHASSNAPVKYFDKPAAFSSHQFWDGAMAGLNNPVLIGVTEALACIGKAQMASLQVRSIGTGSVFLPLTGGNPPLVQAPVKPDYFNDLGEASTSILDDPPDEATFEVYAILDGRFTPPQFPIQSKIVVRMNPLVQPVPGPDGTWMLPQFNVQEQPFDESGFAKLVSLGIDAKDPGDLALIEAFCDAWLADIVPNQPIRANSDTLACEIGHPFFSGAKAVW
jgi:hypothetical protein